MIEADSIRPAGLQRKMVRSDLMATETAGGLVGPSFPHAVKLIGVYYLPKVATGTAPSIIDIGTTDTGEELIKDFSLTHVGSTIGTLVDVGASGNLLLRDLPPGTTLYIETDGASTNGDGWFIFEYVDNSY